MPKRPRSIPPTLGQRTLCSRPLAILAATAILLPATVRSASLSVNSQPFPSGEGGQTLVIPLDNTGIADWRFLNPRALVDVPSTADRISFDNRTSDRTIYVKFALRFAAGSKTTDQHETALRDILGDAVAVSCKKQPNPKKIRALITVTVQPRSEVPLPASAIRTAMRTEGGGYFDELLTAPLQFEVGFHDENDTPPNRRGAVLFAAIEWERPTEPHFFGTGSIAWSTTPSPDGDNDGTSGISAASPFGGDRIDQFSASGRLNFAKNLGSRASFDIAAVFKGGALGESEQDDVTVDTYWFDVYSTEGYVLRYGRYKMATPSSKIAVSESGEGFELRWRGISAGHIIKRESSQGEPNDENEDHRVFILQARNFSTGALPVVRNVSGLLLYGDNGDPDRVYDYWTTGLDLSFAFPGARLSGNVAWYRSWRNSDDSLSLADGSGDVGLLSLTRSWHSTTGDQTLKVDQLVTLELAAGSSDDPDTPDHDESYLGETAAFAPDKLFLSSLAKNLDVAALGQVTPGLANKEYGALVYVNNTFSVLDWLGRSSRIVGADDVKSRATIVRAHAYRFKRAVSGEREAGYETSLEFQVETPQGVKVSFLVAWFFVGTALDSVFREDPWSAATSVSVKI